VKLRLSTDCDVVPWPKLRFDSDLQAGYQTGGGRSCNRSSGPESLSAQDGRCPGV